MPAPTGPAPAPYGPQTAQIRRFLQRLAALPATEWDAAAAEYAALQGSTRFLGADRALSAAVAAAQRERERDAALGPLVQLVQAVREPDGRGAPGAADGTPGGASDAVPLAPVAEAALAAVLALLVRDVLSASVFATLYGPFAERVPVETLG